MAEKMGEREAANEKAAAAAAVGQKTTDGQVAAAKRKSFKLQKKEAKDKTRCCNSPLSIKWAAQSLKKQQKQKKMRA